MGSRWYDGQIGRWISPVRTIRNLWIVAIAVTLVLACQGSETQTAPPSTEVGHTVVSSTVKTTPTFVPTAGSADTSTYEADAETPTISSVTVSEATTPPSQGRNRSKIVFISELNGQTDLWWVNSDGTGLEQLTDDSLIERWPRWSPSGNMLAYTTRPDSITVTSDLLWILDVEKKEKRRLLEHELEGISAPTWSPDNSTIAYDTWATPGAPRIFLVRVGTGEQVEISRDRSDPLWSPDGQRLAVLGPPVEIELGWSSPVGFFSIISIDGEPLDHLNRGWDWQKHVTGMAWSHLGDRLLVASEAGGLFMPGVASLEVVEVRDQVASIGVNHMMKCNDYDCDFYSPSWFPGDEEILFIAAVPFSTRAAYDTPAPDGPKGKWWIYRATDDLATIQTVFESDVSISEASLSPDGKQVVFVQGEYADAEIWVLDLDTGKATQLTNNDVNDSQPLWQPEP
jgi:dipeptidyl aminopeptidase/acylaminoacyl peptidase